MGVYRPPSRAPKGAWARHLHQQRRERGLSQAQAFELVYEGLHLSKRSRAVYTALDMGDRQPRPKEAEYLASVFGWPPDADAEPEAATPDLAAAVMALTVELEAMRLEREAWRRGVVAVLRSYEDGQVPEGLLDALAPRLPEDARP